MIGFQPHRRGVGRGGYSAACGLAEVAPSAQTPLLVAPWLEAERSSRWRAVELTVGS